METTFPPESEVRDAANAVVEYALEALQPPYQRWDKTVNMSAAEFVWNMLALPQRHVPVGCDLDPMMQRLIRHLTEFRRAKWPDAAYMVFGLDVFHERGEIVFRFELSWDDGETAMPCEITVDDGCLDAPARN